MKDLKATVSWCIKNLNKCLVIFKRSYINGPLRSVLLAFRTETMTGKVGIEERIGRIGSQTEGIMPANVLRFTLPFVNFSKLEFSRSFFCPSYR